MNQPTLNKNRHGRDYYYWIVEDIQDSETIGYRDVVVVEVASAGTHESGTYTEWVDVFLPRTAGRRKMPEPPRVGLEFNGFRFVTPVDLFPRTSGPGERSFSGGLVSNGAIEKKISPLPQPVQTGFHFGGYYIPKAGPGMMWEAREDGKEGEDRKPGGAEGPERNEDPVGSVGQGGNP